MSDYTFEPAPAVEILVALHPTVLVRDMEIDRPGVELGRHGLDSLYVRSIVTKQVLDRAVPAARVLDYEAESSVRDLSEYFRTGGQRWANQLAVKYAEALATVRR